VVRADGSRSSFVITKVTVVGKTAFPSRAVFGPTAKAVIRLITCTGPFNTDTGSYVDSLIAWGHPAPSLPAARTRREPGGGFQARS
jgi:hypothetical protein